MSEIKKIKDAIYRLTRRTENLKNEIDHDDVGCTKHRQRHVNDMDLAIQALQEKLERENPQPLGLEELEKIELLGWVWIEITEKMEIGKSGYYQKNSDWSDSERFCCGYPGTMCGFRYCDYGKTWLAYRYEPKHIGEAANMKGE